jgi:hypothetical protein
VITGLCNVGWDVTESNIFVETSISEFKEVLSVIDMWCDVDVSIDVDSTDALIAVERGDSSIDVASEDEV